MVKTREEYNAYMRVYNLERYYRIKREMYEYLGDKCSICGNKYNSYEIDHKDRTQKVFEVSKKYAISQFDRYKELDKCQLLCKQCHTVKSIEERGQTVTKNRNVHGTLSSYRYCKCSICRLNKSFHTKYGRSVPQSILRELFNMPL